MSRDYYSSSDKVPLISKEKLMKVADSERSEEFMKKSNTEELICYKNMWIQIYKEILRVLSIN